MEKVRNAIIQAAGLGSRCVPLTYDVPKALLKINGKPMIEYAIEQLLEKDISEIIIIVNYRKEMFEYLVSKYGVVLVNNPESLTKNTLSSLYYALEYLGSSYIVWGDNLSFENLFNTYEKNSWLSCVYMNEKSSDEWFVNLDDDGLITSVTVGGGGEFALAGPAYISSELAVKLRSLISEYYHMDGTDDFYWTEVIVRHLDKLPVYMRDNTGRVYDIDDLDALREIDSSYRGDAGNRILKEIYSVFGMENDIKNIMPIKTGITNNSFVFEIAGKKYVYRVARDVADNLIDRKKENLVYNLIRDDKISDDVVYFNTRNGHKISVFIDNIRHCDINNWDDVAMSMEMLKAVHEKNYKIDYVFDLFHQIDLHEATWVDHGSSFSDYDITKANVLNLKQHFDKLEKKYTLCHIDNSNFNFLFASEGCRERRILIDWEYAAMQEPHLDIIAFAVFANYNKEKIDKLLELYFGSGNVSELDRLKAYGYTSILGFLWYLWYEHECFAGAPYRQYAVVRYNYAKEFYQEAMKLICR